MLPAELALGICASEAQYLLIAYWAECKVYVHHVGVLGVLTHFRPDFFICLDINMLNAVISLCLVSKPSKNE